MADATTKRADAAGSTPGDARASISSASAGGAFHIETARLICAAVVFASAFGLYLKTLAPTVTLVDSGELIVAARGLGVAHPPGFPLYVLLAHAATLLPVGNVAMRVNLASAVWGALAAAIMTMLVSEAMLTGMQLKRVKSRAGKRAAAKKGERRKRARQPDGGQAEAGITRPNSRALLVLVPAIVAGLLFAFSRTLWAYATIAEVYTLNVLLITVISLLLFRWRRQSLEAEEQKIRPESNRLLYLAAFAFGLALGVHHVTVGLMLPAFAAAVYAGGGRRLFKDRAIPYAALSALAGLGIYLYLPVAAARSPVMNWGDPRTFEQFWWHVTGKQYQVFLSFSPETMAAQSGEFIRFALREFGPRWLPLALALAAAGFVEAFRRDRAAFWFLTLIILANLPYALNYDIAEDKDAYYLPTFFATALASGFGARYLMAKAYRVRMPDAIRSGGAVAVLLLLPALALGSSYPFNNRSQYRIAEDYVEDVFNSIEPGGMLLTMDWQIYSPMLYYHEVEGRRRDVVAIDVNLLRRSWYFEYLARVYPALMEASRDKVDAFLEDLKRWERQPELYERDVTLNERIGARFYDMIMSFVNAHARSAPVYLTQDVAVNQNGPDRELTQLLVAAYPEFIPKGLVFELSKTRGFKDPGGLRLKARGLNDGSIRFEEDDVVRLKVLPVYLSMLVNRGRYFVNYGQRDRAMEAYGRALEIDPRFEPAKRALAEIGKIDRP